MDGLPWDRWMVEEESEACGGEEIVEVEKQISPLRSSQSTRAASVEMTILFGCERSGEQRWLVQRSMCNSTSSKRKGLRLFSQPLEFES
jgi:hypothetical protein